MEVIPFIDFPDETGEICADEVASFSPIQT
jgi:hypothetical protein